MNKVLVKYTKKVSAKSPNQKEKREKMRYLECKRGILGCKLKRYARHNLVYNDTMYVWLLYISFLLFQKNPSTFESDGLSQSSL